MPCFFFQAEDGIRDFCLSRGLGDVYKRQVNIPSSPGRKTFQLVNLISSGEENIAQPVLGKSGMIYTMSRADGYIIIDKNQEGLKKGQNVQVFMF